MKPFLAAALAVTLLFTSCKKEQDSIAPDNSGTPTGTTSGTPQDNNKPGTPTEVGKPVGAMTTQTIGPAGGTLTASDGKLTLTIPAGALTKETTISVEPVENTSGLSVGTGYHFLPDGTQFAKPATFTYRYTDDEMAGADPNRLGIVVQQPDHSWRLTRRATIDPAQRTITSQINHFSWWSVVTQFKLTSKKSEVVPGEKAELTLLFSAISFEKPKDIGDELSSPIIPVGNASLLREWTLNGQLFPNQDIDGSLELDPESTPIRITYTAPKTLPAKNKRVAAVNIQLEVEGSAKLMLIANIRIVSPGELTVDGTTYEDATVNLMYSKWLTDGYKGDSYYLTMSAKTKSGKPVSVLLWLKEFTGPGKYTLQGDGDLEAQHSTYQIGYQSEAGGNYSNAYWGTCQCELPPLLMVPVSVDITQFEGEGGTTQGTFSATLYADREKSKTISVRGRFRGIVDGN